MAANNTKKAMQSVKTQPLKVTPIGTEIILPNHSGVADHREHGTFRDTHKIDIESSEGTGTNTYSIKLKCLDNEAKPKIAWWDMNDTPFAWIVGHDYLSYPSNRHQHLSFETSDSSGVINTRLEIPWGADVVDVETHNSNFVVGGTGNLTVTQGDTTLNGLLTVNGTTVLVDSTGTATMRLDRAATTNFTNFVAATNGTDQWSFGLRNDSTNDFHFRNNVNSTTPLKITQAATASIELTGNEKLSGTLLIGASSFTQTAQEEIALTSTDTSGNPYGLFVTGSFAPASASTANPSALGFTIGTSGSQTLSGNASGVNAVVEHGGTGTLTQATGAQFITKKSSTGPITTAYGFNVAIQNSNATGAITNGVGINVASPTTTGAITTNIGINIANQGSSNVTNSIGILIANQTGSSGLSLAAYIEGGLFYHNVSQSSSSDFVVFGASDGNTFVVDVSANTVQVGAATASDSAKFYVSGKISTSGELEVNGDLNHDGSNVGFFGTAPTTKPTVTGSRGGNAALASLLTALANLGLITDSTSA